MDEQEKVFCDKMDKQLASNMVVMLKHDFEVIKLSYAQLECFYVRELFGDLYDEIIKQMEIFKKWDESLNG